MWLAPCIIAPAVSIAPLDFELLPIAIARVAGGKEMQKTENIPIFHPLQSHLMKRFG